ncbi:hypothetical protein HYPSUDRAFT_36192 [Hypholoma sublateritium FD-334 SS-4]|uniref:Uncharacterized protein n=1 Tax=Hypholoma sublateritium (strain FD-334 SS-4) TaxID=945553 RepID=A0A0D2PD37_HYPSF|nr:hypothetical protein HYPSUDRAFT_36192 [Hypholoma sublateritium FD-334 SS-4]
MDISPAPSALSCLLGFIFALSILRNSATELIGIMNVAISPPEIRCMPPELFPLLLSEFARSRSLHRFSGVASDRADHRSIFKAAGGCIPSNFFLETIYACIGPADTADISRYPAAACNEFTQIHAYVIDYLSKNTCSPTAWRIYVIYSDG